MLLSAKKVIDHQLKETAVMAGEKVLLIEDDKNISKLVKYNLDKAGFNCSCVITGEDAFQFLESSPADIIILDIMLPKMDGFEVCKRIRQNQRFLSVPIIMLTARGEEVDRIVGFELGADDYMVKPFSPRELILRAKAVLRRGRPAFNLPKEIIAVSDITIDIPRHKVTVHNKEVILTSMEFKLLETLMRRRGRVQTRDQLLNDVWDMDASVTTRTIDTHIKKLRQKLGKLCRLIETVRGHGYRFSEDD